MTTGSPNRGAWAVAVAALLWTPATYASEDSDDAEHPRHEHDDEHEGGEHDDDEHEREHAGQGPAFGLDLTLNTALSWYTVEEPPVTGAHDLHRNGVSLQELEVAAGAAVGSHLRLDTATALSEHGVELEEAYISAMGLPLGVSLRAGQFLTRVGRANAAHLHAWDFTNQALVVGKLLGSEGNRGAGLEIAWQLPLPWRFELSASGHHIHGEETARSFFVVHEEHEDEPEATEGHDHGEAAPVAHPRDLQYVIHLDQAFALARQDSLRWGLSATLGPHGGGRAEIYGTDLTLTVLDPDGPQRLTWQTEAMLRHRRESAHTLRDWGGYTQLVVRLAQQWEAGVRYEIVSGVEGDELDPEWTALRQRISPQVTFLPVRGARIRLQAEVGHLPDQEQPWQIGGILALELRVGTGKHHHDH